jgi:hypothetical protein
MFENWNARSKHIRTHFQQGERMASWKDPWPGNEECRDNPGSGDGEDENDDGGVGLDSMDSVANLTRSQPRRIRA